MTKKETKQMIDDMFQSLSDEGSGLSKEEVLEPAIINFVLMFRKGEISGDELIQIGKEINKEFDYSTGPIDIDALNELINKEKEK